MPEFRCNCCGNCCKDFEYLPIYEWEASNLKNLADEKKIKISIKPYEKNTFIDELTGTAVCILFGVESPCPFLIDNKCCIYYNRPLICRQFPLSSTPYFNMNSPDSFGASSFFDCQHFGNKTEFENFFKLDINVEKKKIENYLYKTYGEIYDYAKQVGLINETIKNLIIEFSLEEKIRMIKPEKNENEVVPFFEYLQLRKLITSDNKKNFFEKFKIK